MTITLGDKPTTSALSLNSDTLGSRSASVSTAETPVFGQLMSEILQSRAEITKSDLLQEVNNKFGDDGQEIADSALVESEEVPTHPSWPLKEVTLGPNLNLITSDTAAPDPQSLEAFARAQGLDENAVNWLFGAPQPGNGTEIPKLLPTNTSPPAVGLLATPTANTAEVGLSSQNASAKANAGIILTASPPAVGLLATPTADTAEVGLSSQNASAKANAGNILTAAQALVAMVDSTTHFKKPVHPAPTDTTEDGTPIHLLRMPPPAAVWMQRSLMNGVMQEAVAAQKGTDIVESELDLGAEWGPDLLNDLLAEEGLTSNGSSATGTQGTAYANFAARWDAQATHRTDAGNAGQLAPTDQANTAARNENIQNLADKMGQAVGQRILSEMEKGQWHLKLQLRPATLGHIEVEMRMRSGEFDAIFTAPNATTRDLLQDGMSKLRETLGQMGMDVASIHVGDGQTGQSGGQPTPGTHRGKSASSEGNAEASATDLPQAPLVKAQKDGLDVLV